MRRGCHKFQPENRGVQRSGAASECYMSKHRGSIATVAQNTADSGLGAEGCTERGALPVQAARVLADLQSFTSEVRKKQRRGDVVQRILD